MSRRGGGHLAELENEAIWIIREVSAWFERPVLLFSGGKDSIVLTWLARRAFHPAPLPFPLLHIDTALPDEAGRDGRRASPGVVAPLGTNHHRGEQP